MRPNAAQKQNIPQDSKTAESIRYIAGELRSRYPDYDRWTTADLPRLAPVMRQALLDYLTISDNDVTSLVPKSFFRLYGDAAPAVLTSHLLLQARETNTLGAPIENFLAGGFASAAGYPIEETTHIDTHTPITVPLTNTGNGPKTARVSPAGVFNFAVTTAIFDASYQEDQQAKAEHRAPQKVTGVRFQLPASLFRGVAANNPNLPKLTTAAENNSSSITVTPRMAYAAGFDTQSGLSDAIGPRRSIPMPSNDRAVMCRIVADTERDIADSPVPDVDLYVAFKTGAFRAQLGDCPEVSAPATPRAAGANVR